MNNKEFLYVGYYIDSEGKYVLKIGTTNDMERRKVEHNRAYRRAKTNTMPKENSFEYLWSLPLSPYNTLRYEDKNREMWKEKAIGTFVRNDRFVLSEVPDEIEITIKKTYTIKLK